MKKPVKMSAVAGFFLFGVAALFSIALLLALGDITGGNPAAGSALYRMGKMFTSVYGLCSVLIPAFLVIAAIQCFSDTWTVRRGVLLVGSFLPFFTFDALEHALRLLAAGNSGAVLGIKISAALLTCALVLAAEYLILLLISDLIESSLLKEKSAQDADDEEEDYDDRSLDDQEMDIAEDGEEEAPVSAAAQEETEGEELPSFTAAIDSSEPTSRTLIDGSENPFANFFGSPLSEPTAEAVEEAAEEAAPAEPTIEQAEEAAAAGEPYQAAVLAAPVREAPRYNESARLQTNEEEEDEPSEMLELNTFDPEKDSFDGYKPQEEEIGEMEPVDDDIAAFEQQNAGDFDDDFYDIDLNADDEQDDYEQRLEREELEREEETEEEDEPPEEESDEIAAEKQKSTSLDSIFAEMDDDAAREPLLDDRSVPAAPVAPAAAPAEAASPAPLAESAPAQTADESFEEPVFDEETALDFADDEIFEEPEVESDGLGADDGAESEENYAEPVFDDAIFSDTAAAAESEEEAFAEDEDFDDADDTFVDSAGETMLEEPIPPADFDEVPVVDPLAPPVVDANGIPYETAVSEAEVLAAQEEEAAAASAGSPAPLPQATSPAARSAMSVTVTAAAPAHESERPRKKNYGVYKIPTQGVLDDYPGGDYQVIDEETKQAGEELKATLAEFKIEAEVTGIRKGPVVTMFEILPAPGVKLSKIVALQDNIALRLAASSVRIVAPIPGKHAVGIEVPNKERAIVGFKEIIEEDLPQFKKMAIPVVLGKDISGEAQLIDLAKTPHLLIAGSTGAGKSVCVNTMILSILYKRSPQEVKLIMIDPKVVELKLYNDIPHLLTPVITEPKRAFQSLQYCLCEMERRYALLDGMGVRDIVSYNNRIVERHIATEKLPYIVVIIDEFADLMATTGKELESTLARLAAMSRAVGIHLVLATQRPSIDVITGLIKANIPSRIAFMVASKMDSRIIIDQVGAEKLLGKGDMLYASATDPFPVRIQGTLVNDNEVERVVNCVKEYGEPDYIDDEIFVDDDDEGEGGPGLFGDGEDPLYDQALEIVMQAGKASASYIQRRLKIGYNRAARLVEEMEERGIVGPANGSKPREVIHVPS